MSINRNPPYRKFFPVILLVLALFACNFFNSAPTPTIQASKPIPLEPTLTSSPVAFPTFNLPTLLPTISNSPIPASPEITNSPSPIPTSTSPIPASITTTPLLPAVTNDIVPVPAPAQAFQPRFEPGDCAFPIPEGYSPECGYLSVPENRARADTPFIQLHVAIFRSQTPGVAPDPVVYLSGGPGNSAFEDVDDLLASGLGEVLQRRDLILFDQRGVGYSRPSLECDDMRAFRRCRNRLIEDGIDLSAYTSAASAADVNDLQLALGYPSLNLYGVSYGSRLALTIMRDYPQVVRSAVLEGVLPPQVNLYETMGPNAESAFAVLFRLCAADPTCAAAYPDLENTFYSAIDRLNANPGLVPFDIDGTKHAIKVDSGQLIGALVSRLYSRTEAARAPKMIFEAGEGNYDILVEQLTGSMETSSISGMKNSVNCAEEIPFNTLEGANQEAQSMHPVVAEFYQGVLQAQFSLCWDWEVPPADGRENSPVVSDLPTLLMAGEFDPITPPDWGRLAAASLSNGYFFEFPGHGHHILDESSCALAMALAFWDNPTLPPDSTCIQETDGINFALR